MSAKNTYISNDKINYIRNLDLERVDIQCHDTFQQNFVRNLHPVIRNPKEPALVEMDKPHEHIAQRYRNLVARLIEDWWLWELMCWTISALCLCALTGLFSFYNDRILPSSWPYGITLNAYIAIFSAIFKSTLAVPVEESLGQLKWEWFHQGEPRKLVDFERFDEASRGPWGSLALLWHRKGRRLASLGAYITVFSLALDPFFQQIVSYPQRSSNTGRSFVTRVKDFRTADPIQMVNNTPTIRPDYPLMSIVASFITNNGSVPGFSPFCPANDCKWPDFNSLGVCGTCSDISNMLEFACQEETGDWRKETLLRPRTNYTIDHYPTRNTTGLPQTESCGWYFNASSDSPMLTNGYVVNALATNSTPEVLLMRQIRLDMYETGRTFWGASILYGNTSMPLLDFVTVASPNIDHVLANKTPVAHECALRWCVKTIAASYTNGTYEESVKAIHINNTRVTDLFTGYPDIVGPTENIPQIFHYNLTHTVDGEDFFIPNATAFQGLTSFNQYVPQYITNASHPMQLSFYDNPRAKTMPLTAIIGSSPWMPPNNIDRYVQDFATALTRTMRTYPNTTERVFGTGATETFIAVSWPWLILPVALLMTTLLLLISTILLARGHDVGIWKTSALAVLLHGFDDEARSAFKASSSMMTAREQARNYSVRFDSTGQGVQRGRLSTALTYQRTWSS